jgi:AcrR family transcriptional regulator
MPPQPDVKPAPLVDRTAAAILDAAVRVWSERGGVANLTDVAAAAGVSRATLYRYYPNREALLKALAAGASRVVAAGLDRAPVEVAIERIVRGFASVADRYAVIEAEHVELDLDEKERLIEAPIRAVFERGVETGVLRQDIPLDVLRELFGGVLLAAVKLAARPEIGIEEASAAATSVFLAGARPR